MSYDAKELRQADRALAAAGVPHALEDLGNDPRLFRPVHIEPLFTLLQRRWKSSYIEMHAFRALARARLGKALRRRAAAACINALRARPDPEDDDVEMIAGALIELADDSSIRDIGELALDRRYGTLRNYFLHALSGLKGTEVEKVLEAAVDCPETRLEAFQGLARRNPANTLTLMSSWIGNEGSHPGEFRKLHQRLHRRVEGFTASSAPHRIRGPLPRGLPRWSVNIDGDDLKPLLTAVAKVSGGTVPPEAALEVQAAAADLPRGKRLRFAFLPRAEERESSVWIDLLAEDEDAFILKVVAGSRGLMDRLQRALEAAIDTLEDQRPS